MDYRFARYFVGRLEERDVQRLRRLAGAMLVDLPFLVSPGVYTEASPLVLPTNGEEPLDSVVDIWLSLMASRNRGKAYCSLCYLCVNTDLASIPSVSCTVSHSERVRL
ncbi:hypothetical protein [Thermus phage TSP4]|nr:hypothetical protein [Thermus phage TSP4]